MKNNRWMIAVLGITLMVQTPLVALAETKYTSYGEYISGTEKEQRQESDYTVIEIASEEELLALAEQCRLDTWSCDKMVKLNADITLQEQTDICIPSFGGIFEGNGYTISNLEITRQGSAVGLFRYVQEGGIVRNLHVQGRVVPDGSQSQVGGIVGINYGKLYNCTFSGHIAGDSEVGGIAGVNEFTGEIRRCSSDAAVSGNHSTGGITGSNHGTLNNCSNAGDINTYSTEVSYDLEDFTIENIENLNSTDNVAAHTDSGGIAGISDGKIYYCTNSGTVGYSHVGYNVGGIVGRLHQGYLQNCTNTGHILGRKDVGGIAGQMEPFLEIQYLSDKLQELDRETDKLIELLDAAHQDISSYGKQASTLAKALSGNLKNVSTAAGNLTGTANELWYIYNNELTGLNQNLKTLNNDWADIRDAEKGNEEVTEDVPVDVPDVTVSGGDSLQNIVDTVPSDQDIESYLAALEKFGDDATVHIDNMAKASGDRSGGITDNLNTLNNEMEAAINHLEQLTDVLEAGADKTSADVDAVVEQAKVLRTLISEIRDDLFRYEGITVEDVSDEAASTESSNPGAETGTEDGAAEAFEEGYYDTTAFQQGKITLCVNKGLIEADANVGGIVGQLATEYDFDPEEDITLIGTESFNIEQTIKAVVRDSCNYGDVTAKKDCVGGIVGKAEFGAVISCESYGDISSTGGSNVGGIAGTSGYAIRSCYTMGALSGKNNVGGIVGQGCDIFYSYAYNDLETTGECAGAIAGSLKESGILYGNYYVDGSVGGVDNIGYSGGAAPLSYEEFCSMEGVPEEFTDFTITFMADGEELASYSCGYGDTLSEEQIPAIPEKEGYYGRWPEFNYDNITGNKVLEAVYERWNTSLVSEEKDENGRARVLVEGEFLPEEKLQITRNGEEISFAIRDDDKESTSAYDGPVAVRILCDDTDHTVVEVNTDAGFSEVETTVMGHYLLFHMDQPGTFRVTIPEKDSRMLWYAAGAGIFLLLLVVILVMRKAWKKKAGRFFCYDVCT